MLLSKKEFERLIIEAVEVLPFSIRKEMENVEITLEEGEAKGKNLFGFYHGVPRTERGMGYSFVLPDKITIYKKTIEEGARTEKELSRLVRRVVWHEIGHHFGFSEAGIRRLEKKWEKDKKV